MTGNVTEKNKKKNTVKQKFVGIKLYIRQRDNTKGPKVPQEGWEVAYKNMEKEKEELIRPKPRWIFADSFSEIETTPEEVNTVVLV